MYDDDGSTVVQKWPYSNPPKIGELHMVNGRPFRIADYSPKGLASYDLKTVTLSLRRY